MRGLRFRVAREFFAASPPQKWRPRKPFRPDLPTEQGLAGISALSTVYGAGSGAAPRPARRDALPLAIPSPE
jgi:hypothetical protein